MSEANQIVIMWFSAIAFLLAFWLWAIHWENKDNAKRAADDDD